MTFVTTIDLSLADKIKHDLIEQGFEIVKPPYTIFSAKKKGLSCTLYESGKLTVQGKELDAFMEFYLEPQILKSFDHTYKNISVDVTARIGIDESGKGDFFGPLCIAGVFAGGDEIHELQKLGVKDSKTISDGTIIKLGQQIEQRFVHHKVKINPLRYNEVYAQFKNLNRLLAWGHATTIENLVEKTKCNTVIIDQFAYEHVVLTALKRKNLEISLTQRHRAEEDLVVAAASILARKTFLESLLAMEKEYGLKFPKGASKQTVEAGKKFVRQFGPETLNKVGKLHFKTSQIILGTQASEWEEE